MLHATFGSPRSFCLIFMLLLNPSTSLHVAVANVFGQLYNIPLCGLGVFIQSPLMGTWAVSRLGGCDQKCCEHSCTKSPGSVQECLSGARQGLKLAGP